METVKRKARVIEFFEAGNLSLHEMSRRLNLDRAVIKTWHSIYKHHGKQGLLNPPCTPRDESFKLEVVQYMIETAKPTFEVAGRFNLHSRATLWKWMKKYMSEDDWSLYYLRREQRDHMKKDNSKEQTDLEKVKKENELLRAENAYLKKLRALVQEKKSK